jgi:hypothetical protein
VLKSLGWIHEGRNEPGNEEMHLHNVYIIMHQYET